MNFPRSQAGFSFVELIVVMFIVVVLYGLFYGPSEATKRKRRREDYRRWERGRSMELWQLDVMGRVHLADGRELKVITGIDDHSRFVVCATLVARATARPVCSALLDALRRHGVPEGILYR